MNNVLKLYFRGLRRFLNDDEELNFQVLRIIRSLTRAVIQTRQRHLCRDE
jgi:hypothetical protein